MNIAIIGAGNVGRALAASIQRAGHNVTLAARRREQAAAAAAEVGAAFASTDRDALTGADLVILAVPADALPDVAGEIADVARGKVVVDATNRMSPDPTTASNAEELQERLPDASVVKAFNTAFAAIQAEPNAGGVQADGFVAGDDDQAKQRVLALVESIGFRPVDAGPLAAARMLEGMAWLNISRNREGGSWRTAWKLVEAGR